jgi:membrane protease YdiL (CAAX protease family)
MKTENKPKAVNWFIFIVLAISTLLAGTYYLIFPEKDQISYTIMALLYMFMPLISALIVDKLIMKRKSLKSWAMNFNPNKWFLAAWPAVVAFAFLATAINTLWPGISFSSEMTGFWDRMAEQLTPEQLEMQKAKMEMIPLPYWLLAIIQGLIAGLTINAVAGFGEESAWRGFMVKEYRNLKFWDASLRIGIIWGIWHAPLVLMGHNYPEHNIIGVGMMTIWCILLSPLFLYVRLKTRSVIAASIMHGTLNATAGLPVMYLIGGNDLTLGLTGFSGFVSLIIVIGIMLWYDLKLSKTPITNRLIAQGLNPDSLKSDEGYIQ